MATIEEVEDGTKLTAEITSPSDLAVAVYEMTHHAIEKYAKDDGLLSCEIGGSASLGAVLKLALIFCKKPDGLKVGRIPKDEATVVFESVTTELLVYTSLLVAHQYSGIRNHDDHRVALAASFSPALFGRALAQWQQLYPELRIEDYLEAPVAAIAREELNNPENHCFTHKRIKNVSPAFVLRNNGSIN